MQERCKDMVRVGLRRSGTLTLAFASVLALGGCASVSPPSPQVSMCSADQGALMEPSAKTPATGEFGDDTVGGDFRLRVIAECRPGGTIVTVEAGAWAYAYATDDFGSSWLYRRTKAGPSRSTVGIHYDGKVYSPVSLSRLKVAEEVIATFELPAMDATSRLDIRMTVARKFFIDFKSGSDEAEGLTGLPPTVDLHETLDWTGLRLTDKTASRA